eukprot:767060-Hanusia_phi.AAC.3
MSSSPPPGFPYPYIPASSREGQRVIRGDQGWSGVVRGGQRWGIHSYSVHLRGGVVNEGVQSGRAEALTMGRWSNPKKPLLFRGTLCAGGVRGGGTLQC